MNPRFRLHSVRSPSSRGARAALREVQRQRGHLPHLHALLAEAEPVLRAYMALGEQVARCSLTAQERQVVLMQANVHNQAAYCMAGHSAIAAALGMPKTWLQALRDGQPLPDARAEALRRFTRVLLQQRGEASDAEWAAFLAAGYQPVQALEVVLALSLKTLSNFSSRMAALPLDTGHQPWAWSPLPGEPHE